MKNNKTALSSIILLVGLTVFLVQMTFSNALPQSLGLFIKIGLSVILLVMAFFFISKGKEVPYGRLFYLYFTASVAVLLSSLTGDWGLVLFNLDTDSYTGLAIAKFSESVPIIVSILVLTSVLGIKPDYLYLRKGRLKYGLIIGMLFFIGFTVLTIFTSNLAPLFNEKLQNDNLSELSALVPWVLIFVLFNGFMEELLFRGLFLKYFESIIGFRLSNILTAFIFAIAHLQVTYAANMIVFLVVVFLLGLLLGDVMKKSNSIIAPTLIHAGADVMLILPMFSKYL